MSASVKNGSVKLAETNYSFFGSLQNSVYRTLQSAVLAPYKLTMAFCTIWNIKKNPNLSITEQMPAVQGWIESFACRIGIYRGGPHIKEIHLPDSPFGSTFPYLKLPVSTSHLLLDPYLCKAAFKPHRQVDFNGASSFDIFFELVKEIFSELTFEKEDVLFQCGPDSTKIHNANFVRVLYADKDKLVKVIQDQAEILIDRWKTYADKQEPFELSNEINMFATDVITTMIFGEAKGSSEICKAIQILNGYIFKRALKLATNEDRLEFQEQCAIFKRVTYQILEANESNPIPLFENVKFTRQQQVSDILTAFFAGQETTAFALTKILAEAALDSTKQALILESVQSSQLHDLLKIPELMKIIEDSLLEAPPANGVAKRLKKNMTMTFEDENGKVYRKKMRIGERLIASISGVTNKILEEDPKLFELQGRINKGNIFGHGTHQCPGRKLALTELAQLPVLILSIFNLSTTEVKFNHVSRTTKQALPFYIKIALR